MFGSRSSPKIFDSLSTSVCWIASNKLGVSNILHLLDDADRTISILTMLFKQLKIQLAPHKIVGPTQCLKYLCVILDTKKMEARLPAQKKIGRIWDIIQTFLVLAMWLKFLAGWNGVSFFPP